ncbi:MAG: hypothetical protein N2379_10905 [Verrucomicrobiae bacterium]|nr:hypothetical protein [Verrucomicrobiae bacterium]
MEIQSKNEQVALRSLQTMDARLMRFLRGALVRSLQHVIKKSQSEYLQGPRPKKIQSISYRLWSSLWWATEPGANSIIGRVGSTVPYAAYHEFGFYGTVNVPAHTRILRVLGARGRPLREIRRAAYGEGGVFLGWLETRKQAVQRFRARGRVVTPISTVVRAHVRRVAYPGKPYLRPALEESLPVVRAEIEAALQQAASQ